jgi:hypothetical protein
MTRYTLHVPLYLNDGTAVGDAYLESIEKALARRYGGYTRVESMGAWIGPDDALYREPMILLHVDADEEQVGWKTSDDLRGLAQLIAEALDQEAVYLTEQPIVTHFVERVPAPSPQRRWEI